MSWCCIVVKSSGVHFLSSAIINISAVVAVVTICVQQSMQINKTQTESCRLDGKHRCILLCLRPGHLVLLRHSRQNQWWRSVLIHSHVSSYSLIVIWNSHQHVSSGKKKHFDKTFWGQTGTHLVFNCPWVKKKLTVLVPSLHGNHLPQIWCVILKILAGFGGFHACLCHSMWFTQSLRFSAVKEWFLVSVLLPKWFYGLYQFINTLPDWFTVVTWIICQMTQFLFHSFRINCQCVCHRFWLIYGNNIQCVLQTLLNNVVKNHSESLPWPSLIRHLLLFAVTTQSFNCLLRKVY